MIETTLAGLRAAGLILEALDLARELGGSGVMALEDGLELGSLPTGGCGDRATRIMAGKVGRTASPPPALTPWANCPKLPEPVRPLATCSGEGGDMYGIRGSSPAP